MRIQAPVARSGSGPGVAGIPEGACACGAEGHMASIGPPALGAKGCVEGGIASLRGPPIGGQENDRVSYPCSNPYTLSRFAGLPLKGKQENRWHWILCHI